MDTPLNLGALESPKDPRNIQLGSIQAPIPFPSTYLTDVSEIPTYFQGSTPACSGHAGAWFKSFLDWRSTGKAIALSPRFIYSICKRDDGIPSDDGTYLSQIFATLKNVGACSLETDPNDITLPTAEYREVPFLSSPAFTEAAGNKTQPYAHVDDLSFAGLQQAIYQNKAVILLIWCDSGFFRTTKPVFTSKTYGHFVVAYNYDENGIFIADSTEEDPTLRHKYIAKEYIGFIRDAATAVDIPDWALAGLTSRVSIIRQLIAVTTKLLGLATPKVATTS